MNYLISASILDFKEISNFINNEPYYLWDISNFYDKIYCFIKANTRNEALTICHEIVKARLAHTTSYRYKKNRDIVVFKLTKGKK